MKRLIVLCTVLLFVVFGLSACNGEPGVEPAEPEETSETILCAIVWTPYYSSEQNYLGTLDSQRCLNASVLIINFVEPVSSVSLTFSGASVPYVLDVFDESGSSLGSQVQEAEFNEGDGTLFTIGFSSDSANIGSVHFSGPRGGNRVVIAVRAIGYSRAGNDYNYNFDAFPDGTPITRDTQDSEGREFRTLTGSEFIDWGFQVSTNQDQQ